MHEVLVQRAKEQKMNEYYEGIEQDLCNMCGDDEALRNKASSYFVSLLRGKQQIREVPKDIESSQQLSRELRLLALDRSFTEDVIELDGGKLAAMDHTADVINHKK